MIGQTCAAAAPDAAGAQLRIEGVKSLAVEAPYLEVSEGRPDVVIDQPDVTAPGVRFDVQHFQVPVEQPVDVGFCTGVPAFVDLGEKLRAHLFGRRRGGHNLSQVVSFAGQGIGAGMNAHAVGPAGELVDSPSLPALRLLSTSHQTRVNRRRVTIRVTNPTE